MQRTGTAAGPFALRGYSRLPGRSNQLVPPQEVDETDLITYGARSLDD